MHLYLQLTRSLAVTLIWLYCNKLVLRYVRLRVSDLGQVSIPQPGIVTVNNRRKVLFSCQDVSNMYSNEPNCTVSQIFLNEHIPIVCQQLK